MVLTVMNVSRSIREVTGYTSSRNLAALGVLWALSSPLVAQTVQGRVTEDKTNRDLKAVTVLLIDAQQTVKARTQTADDGSYQVAAPGPGTYTLRFLLPGYRPFFTKAAALAPGQVTEYSPKLVSLAAIGLDTILVEGERVPRYLEEFYRRRAEHHGDFLTRTEIEKWWPAQPTDLVPRLAGFRIAYSGDGRIRFYSRREGGRNCPPLVFLNGAFVGNVETYDVDAFLMVSDLAAVEAYNGPARMPIEFNATGAKCGVIAFWTKR